MSYGPLYPIIDNFLSQSRKERKGYAQLTTRTIFAESWRTLRLGEGMFLLLTKAPLELVVANSEICGYERTLKDQLQENTEN